MRPLDFFFRVVNSGLGLVDLSHQFRNLQYGQHLSRVNVVADIDINIADVAGYLGVQLDILVRNELAGDGQRSGDRLALHRGYCSVGGMWRHRRLASLALSGEPARARLAIMPATN